MINLTSEEINTASNRERLLIATSGAHAALSKIDKLADNLPDLNTFVFTTPRFATGRQLCLEHAWVIIDVPATPLFPAVRDMLFLEGRLNVNERAIDGGPAVKVILAMLVTIGGEEVARYLYRHEPFLDQFVPITDKQLSEAEPLIEEE